jgi:hypothetical protein
LLRCARADPGAPAPQPFNREQPLLSSATEARLLRDRQQLNKYFLQILTRPLKPSRRGGRCLRREGASTASVRPSVGLVARHHTPLVRAISRMAAKNNCLSESNKPQTRLTSSLTFCTFGHPRCVQIGGRVGTSLTSDAASEASQSPPSRPRAKLFSFAKPISSLLGAEDRFDHFARGVEGVPSAPPALEVPKPTVELTCGNWRPPDAWGQE